MDLERQMRQVLCEMQLISYGGVSAWNPSGRGKAGSKPPTGESCPLHEEWAEKWARAVSVLGRENVVSGARAALTAWKVSACATGPLESWEQLSARIVKEGAGWTVPEVANALGVDERDVKRARRELRVDQVRGRPLANIVQMKNDGLSVREIALRSGMPKSTVQDFLKAA